MCYECICIRQVYSLFPNHAPEMKPSNIIVEGVQAGYLNFTIGLGNKDIFTIRSIFQIGFLIEPKAVRNSGEEFS